MTNEIDGLLSALWRASWQGSLVFLFIWLMCRILARRLSADAHCWLWRLSYVKLLVGLLWGGAILLPLLSPAPHPLVATTPQAAIVVHQPKMPTQVASNANASSLAPAAEVAPRFRWQEALIALYLIGVMVCLGRLLIAAWKTRRILKATVTDAAGPEIALAATLAQGMKLCQVPVLARSMAVSSPVFIAGKVVLPAQADYSDAELKMILAHELAHARRRDLLWEWLGTLVQAMFFFHPVVVLARREERLAREAAADALAVEATQAQAADYGKMLLSLSLQRTGSHPVLFGAVGVIEGGTLLHRRLLALRDAASCRDSRRAQWRIAVTLVPLMALIFVPWQVTRGRAQALAIPPIPAAPSYPTMPTGDKEITGVVVDEKGEPVSGIDVSLIWHWSQQKADGTITGSSSGGHVSSDVQGRFAFSRLPAGDFDYSVYSPINQYVRILAPLRISKAETQKALHVVVSTGSLVTGRVVNGHTGEPMTGIFVGAGPIPPGGDLAKWDFWEMPFEGVTDAQGRYQVRVTPGNVFVGVGRITNGTALSRRIRYAARQVSVHPGKTASAPDIPVLLHPIITCVGPDGYPVANTTFRIVPEDIAHGGYILDDHTDATGTVILDRFESGSFSIGQGSRTASGTFHWSPNSPLVINMDGKALSFPSGEGSIQLAEASAALITGTVVSEDDKAIPNALIRIVETDPKSHSALDDHVFRTDASGNFRAPLDPNGEYHAYIRADGFNQVSVSDEPLTVAKGQTTSIGTVHLMRAKGFVSGRVVDNLGKPLSGVLAFVRGGRTFLSAAVTDDQGNFRIPNVVPGEVLRLELCLHGEARDSGIALAQSNDEMVIPGVTASPAERQIVWHPHS